jgi:hypothetical protein
VRNPSTSFEWYVAGLQRHECGVQLGSESRIEIGWIRVDAGLEGLRQSFELRIDPSRWASWTARGGCPFSGAARVG